MAATIFPSCRPENAVMVTIAEFIMATDDFPLGRIVE